MKDELREFESDATSRKTAADWLMKVISGKKPASLHLNGSDDDDAPRTSESAVAVEEMPRAPAPVSLNGSRRGEIKREPPAAEFTAEDLCGAPAVPIIRVATAAKDEISADDVCWVPVERRLKPEPAAPKLQIVQPQEREAPAAQVRQAHSDEPEISTEDISRDPAPFMIAPILNGFATGPEAPEAEKEITAEDIARDWVLQEMSPPPRETRDGAVLPFSYKVIQSAGTGSGVAEQAEAATHTPAADLSHAMEAAPEAMAPETTLPEAPEIPVEVPMPAQASPLEGLDAPARIEVATEIVAEMPAEIAPEPVVVEPVLIEPVAAAAPVIEPEPVVVEPEADLPAAVVPEPVETAAEPMVSMEAAQAPVSEEALEESATETEIESALHDMEVSGEETGETAPGTAASVFARESFWEEAASANGVVRGESAYEKPILQNVKSQHPWSEVFGETGQRPEGWVSAWKTLLRLGSVLPWIARALPMIEAGNLAEEPSGSGELHEMRQDVSGLRLVQYEIRTTVQDHSMQLKRVEEQLGRVRESMESKASETGELAESLRSMTRLVRLAGIGLGGLLLVLVVLMIVMLAR